MALLVAIEGIDGTGKGTQARRLVDSLAASGLRTRLISFPRYAETGFGRQIGEFLNGRFGRLDQVAPALAALLYAGDRFESKGVLQEALSHSDVVVLDRYVPSNMAHQAGKLFGDEQTRLLEWIEHLEYRLYALPRADRVILLDLPVPLAQQLISRKARRDYTDKPADLQEADASYLNRVRSMYLQLAADAYWSIVPVSHADRIRPVSEVAADILRIVQADLEEAPPSSPPC